jgi:hypothetical protein
VLAILSKQQKELHSIPFLFSLFFLGAVVEETVTFCIVFNQFIQFIQEIKQPFVTVKQVVNSGLLL